MSGQDEDDAWRSIVENYGERPRVEPVAEPEPPEPPPADRGTGPGPDLAAYSFGEDAWDEDHFVPPPPPPLPTPPPKRLAAWLGLFGSPAILLVALVLAIDLPSWLGYGLILWFIGGFAYLVVHMQQGPRDPGDDGARL